MGPPSAAPPFEIQTAFEQLLGEVRVGVLITLTPDGPMGSHVPFLVGDDWTRLYVHLSALAQHTQNLQADRRVAFFVAEPDSPQKNPLVLQRINLTGTAVPLPHQSTGYEEIQSRYVAKFKQSAMMFSLADFQLWELQMAKAQFVAGFGQAYRAQQASPRQWVHQRP